MRCLACGTDRGLRQVAFRRRSSSTGQSHFEDVHRLIASATTSDGRAFRLQVRDPRGTVQVADHAGASPLHGAQRHATLRCLMMLLATGDRALPSSCVSTIDVRYQHGALHLLVLVHDSPLSYSDGRRHALRRSTQKRTGVAGRSPELHLLADRHSNEPAELSPPCRLRSPSGRRDSFGSTRLVRHQTVALPWDASAALGFDSHLVATEDVEASFREGLLAELPTLGRGRDGVEDAAVAAPRFCVVGDELVAVGDDTNTRKPRSVLHENLHPQRAQ